MDLAPALFKFVLYVGIGIFAAVVLGELLLISHNLLARSGLISLTFLQTP
jgi:hypothetical protein